MIDFALSSTIHTQDAEEKGEPPTTLAVAQARGGTVLEVWGSH